MEKKAGRHPYATRGIDVRVIRCPHCEEPLPGAANFCAACGQTLTPSPTSITARLTHRPRSLKVPRFFAAATESDGTLTFDEQAVTQTVKSPQRSPGSIVNGKPSLASPLRDPP